MKILRIFTSALFLLLGFTGLGSTNGMHVPRLPKLAVAADDDKLPIWDEQYDVLKHITVANLLTGLATPADLADYQPLSADLTLISGNTTAPSRTLLTKGSTNTMLSYLGGQAGSAELTAYSNLSTAPYGRGLNELASASAARTYLGLVIGTDVQAYSAATASWAAITRASGFDTFATTPSSANLDALVTDDTGSGAMVFATSPALTTPNLGAATGTSLTVTGDLTAGASGKISFTGRAELSSSGTATLSVKNAGATQSAALSYALVNSPNSTDRVVTVTESGKVFDNTGASALVTFTLPTGAGGLWYGWIVRDTDGIRVSAAGSDNIRLGANASANAGYISSTTIGSVVTLQFDGGSWVATSHGGFWGVDGTAITTGTGKTVYATSPTLTTPDLVGTAAAGNAAAGSVGETVTSLVATGSAVSLTDATAANVTTISLTAGDWDVEANVNFTLGSATLTALAAGIHTTTATLPTDGSEAYSGLQLTTTSAVNSITLPRKRVNVSSTTTVYLVGRATFSAGTAAGFGSITARRVR